MAYSHDNNTENERIVICIYWSLVSRDYFESLNALEDCHVCVFRLLAFDTEDSFCTNKTRQRTTGANVCFEERETAIARGKLFGLRKNFPRKTICLVQLLDGFPPGNEIASWIPYSQTDATAIRDFSFKWFGSHKNDIFLTTMVASAFDDSGYIHEKQYAFW